ncbi:hypothetical protein FSP39_002092 [Pinctada imbricata]|uniref:Gamma-glutamylcyclotransferase family protein n=1 Tax=Pinctada imbricata TaxID=66713 RepID=A0AA88XTY4_PINIB|nr:hypothetical protein FSP39_002092 [Pinctada imbricata]
MNKVFVYGTLKSGQPNHHVFESVVGGIKTYIGQGTTQSKYALVIASRYNIPFVLDAEDVENAKNIHGEVYTVDDAVLKRLDELENHPDVYKRRVIPVIMDGHVNQCWCYFLTDFKPEILRLPYLESYDAYGPQGYVPAKEHDTVTPYWVDVKK